jgi:hypothetical protein
MFDTTGIESWLTLAKDIVTLVAAIGAVVMSYLNRGKIQEVNLSVNGRLTELINETRIASHAEGRREGVESQLSRKDTSNEP